MSATDDPKDGDIEDSGLAELNLPASSPAQQDSPDFAFDPIPSDPFAFPPLSSDPQAENVTPPENFDFGALPALAQPTENSLTEDSIPENEVPAETTAAPTDPIQKMKDFSEKMPMENVQHPAAYPFSLMIEGELLPEEREKLLDILSRENMGIREVDLEPQFAGNRVLIPRISEYAGILLVQALRGVRARMRLGPSDSIFATPDTDVLSDPIQSGSQNLMPEVRGGGSDSFSRYAGSSAPSGHPADEIPLTTADSLPQFLSFEVIDTLLASTVLSTTAIEAEHTSKYQDVLENLKRELKYKAHRKGAVGILHFQIHLQPLTLGTQYRMTVTGSAIRIILPDPNIDPTLPPAETSH